MIAQPVPPRTGYAQQSSSTSQPSPAELGQPVLFRKSPQLLLPQNVPPTQSSSLSQSPAPSHSARRPEAPHALSSPLHCRHVCGGWGGGGDGNGGGEGGGDGGGGEGGGGSGPLPGGYGGGEGGGGEGGGEGGGSGGGLGAHGHWAHVRTVVP